MIVRAARGRRHVMGTGEIVGAGVVAHVPTMVMPEAERRELNEGKEISLVSRHRDRSAAKSSIALGR